MANSKLEARLEVPVVNVRTREEFEMLVYCNRKPSVLRGFDLGAAPQLWTPSYLRDACGEIPVKVHVSPISKMDFISKNFAYKTLSFGQFVTRASKILQEEFFFEAGEKYYLRSLGNNPRKDVADFSKDWPQLFKDICLPWFFDEANYFSSVLRISSAQLQLWTHYDVMDNLLVQVVGKKRAVLFAPNEVHNLYLEGDKSAVLDIDDPDIDDPDVTKYPLFNKAVAHECLLQPGDVLFIPALWFHNVTSLEFGVAVNMFWRHLPKELYDNKDPYGNKDPLPAQRAIQATEKAIKLINELPDTYKDFYARRLVSNIESKSYCKQ